jgi:hypothetical protein
MSSKFLLFIDEAGEEGIKKVRPIDEGGSSEYFVMAGIIISTLRHDELKNFMLSLKVKLGINKDVPIHFRDLDESQIGIILENLRNFKFGIAACVSNKRNMRGYKIERIEEIDYEIKNNRKVPKKNSYFYNHTFRYVLESVSEECAHWSGKHYKDFSPIKIILSEKEMSYPQMRAYIAKLSMERRDKSYFNNKNQIDFRVVDYKMIEPLKAKNEFGLQLADCVASMIYKAIDEDNFGVVKPSYMEALAPKFIKSKGYVKGFGFKLLPYPFSAPLSDNQKRSLRAVGYYIL